MHKSEILKVPIMSSKQLNRSKRKDKKETWFSNLSKIPYNQYIYHASVEQKTETIFRNFSWVESELPNF